MSRFYVGQRVRIVRSEAPQRIGCEATVLGFQFSHMIHYGYGFGNYVDLDVDGFGRTGERGYQLAYPEAYLEPLTPPNEACDTEFKASLDELLARQEQSA